MESPQNQRKWYQKKRLIIPLGFFGLLVVVSLFNQVPSSTSNVNSNSQNQSQVKSNSVTIPSYIAPLQIKQEPNTQQNTQVQQPTPTPSSPTYYINSSGNTVQSPTKSQDGSIPAGASARCRDGSYSFSQHRSGTCSHHGGVADWLN